MKRLTLAAVLAATFVFGMVLGQSSSGLPEAHAIEAKTEKPPKGYDLSSTETSGGLWVQRGGMSSPSAGLYSWKAGNYRAAILDFRLGDLSTGPSPFAIAADKDGVQFQIVDESGKVHFVPVTALLKLKDKGK